ncbi:MAG: FAD-dependent thymidylate synthase, partial [Calditrichia bacterium]
MEDKFEKIERPRVEALEEILGQPFKVLNDGFIRVIDYMGSDESIVQAARVSYGKGTKKVHQDRGLIRYLMRHRHTTPFEMCEIKLHVRVPMDTWRQWIRHRMACISEGTEIYFDLPGGIKRNGNQLYKLRIEDIWRKFQPTKNTSRPERQKNPFFRKDRIQRMQLRQVNEDNLTIQHTSVVNVYKNGKKPVFRMTLTDGKEIEATADHLFFFEDGWSTLQKKTGLHE